MNAAGCQHAVLSLLRHSYGVTDARIEGGGKHMHLIFTSPNGVAKIKTTWPRAPIGRDWNVTLDVKTKDLRRLLGDPRLAPSRHANKEPAMEPALAEQIRSKLPSLANQLPPQLPQSTTKTVIGSLALNAVRALRLALPPALTAPFGGRAVALKRLDRLEWEITPIEGDGPHFFSQTPVRSIVTFGTATWTKLSDGFEPFSATAVEIILDPDRPALRLRLIGEIRSLKQPSAPAPITDEPLPAGEGDMRRVLDEIRQIERLTPYRLTRIDGSLSFVAPAVV